MRLPVIHFLLFVALFYLSLSASAERGSSAFESENHEVDHLDEDFTAPNTDVPIQNDNADQHEFNDFAYNEEEEFLENQINFDENGDIIFHPTGLFYHDCPLSIIAAREFEITNKMNNPVTIFTVRSSNRQFHSTLSKNQEIAGGDKLKVNILYLPHQTEFLIAELTIVTSRGEYTLPIAANSITNPYRVDPSLGARFPRTHNIEGGDVVVWERPIVVFNPHNETLHITEVFTSEPFLTLKGAEFQGVGSDPKAAPSYAIKPGRQRVLPESGNGSDTAVAVHTLWSIPPGQEKEIIRVTVSTDLNPGPHGGFLHVRTDHVNLVVPIELFVLSSLVFPVKNEQVFGLFTTAQTTRTIELWLANQGAENVEVLEIIPVEPDANLRVELVNKPVIYAGDLITSRVARLHYTGLFPGQINNKLLVITNNTNAASAVVDVPYSAHVLHGGIRFEQTQTTFYVDIYNLTYPFECSQCDAHGSSLGYSDDLYSALLDDYYHKQNQQQLGVHKNLHTTHHTHTNTHTNTHTTTHTNHNTDSSTEPHEYDNISEHPDHILTRPFVVFNYFDAPAYIYKVEFNTCEEILSTDFTPPTSADILYNNHSGIVAQGYQPWQPFNLILKNALVYALYRENLDFLPKVCNLDITTNISMHRIQLFVLTGAVSMEFMDMPMMEDFGISSLHAAQESASSAGGGARGSNTGGSSGGNGNHEPSDSGDLEVAFSSDGDQWQCDSPHCQSVNADVFHVDMGNQSIHEPRLLRVVLYNKNPYRTVVNFDYASHDTCVCGEGHWPASETSVEFVEPHLSRSAPFTWSDPAKYEKIRCNCIEPSLEEDEVDDAEEQRARTKSDRNIQKIDTLLKKGHISNSFLNEIGNNRTVTNANEPNTARVYSISMRDLSLCRVYPAILRGYTNVATSECRSGAGSILLPDSAKLAPKLKNGDRSSVRVDIYSEHQRLQLHLHFTARAARFRTTIAPPSVDRSQAGAFVIGQGAPLVLRTRSTFSEPLRDFQYFVEPNQVYRIEYESALNTNPSLRTWHTGVYLHKICAGHANNPLHDPSQLPLTPPPADDVSLRGMSVWRCATGVLTGMNFTDAHGPILGMLRRIEGHMQKVSLVAPKVAFDAALKLKLAWANTFTQGIGLPPVAVTMLSPHTAHSFRMQNTTLQLPIFYSPHSYSVRLPTIREGNVQWFYLNVHNPYDVAVSFSLLEDANSETARRMKALGGLFFLPLGLEDKLTPSSAVKAFSRYHCTGLEVGTNQRVSNTPIPCECGKADTARLNDTFCEVDHAVSNKHVDEGLMHRSRSLSLIRSAVTYTSSATVLAGLNQLFPPESEPTKETKGTQPDVKPPSQLPFLPQSTIESVVVVQPRSSSRVGPFLFAPQAQKGPRKVYSGAPHAFYMFNNFTGYDRVDVFTSSGAASLNLVGKAFCAPLNSTANTTVILTPVQSELACVVGSAEVQTVVAKAPPGEIQSHTLVYAELDQFFHLYVQNTGDVGAAVHNIVLDESVCAYPAPVEAADGMWSRVKSLFLSTPVGSTSWSRDVLSEMRLICAQLPLRLPAEASMGLWVKGPNSCEHGSYRRMLTISLDKVPFTPFTVHDMNNHLTMELNFVMSPEFAKVCHNSKASMFRSPLLLNVLCAIALFYGVWQMISVAMLAKHQREKYVSAKQTKARRVRTPSKRAPSTPSHPSTHPAGSPVAVGSPPIGHSAEVNGTVSERVESRSVVPENRGMGIDLSDVLLEEGGGTEGGESYRRERESLGAEPSAGEWTVVRPRLRAVEALHLSRQNTAAHLSCAVNSPPKTRSTISTPTSSPNKHTFATSPFASPEKPPASPQKGPLQGCSPVSPGVLSVAQLPSPSADTVAEPIATSPSVSVSGLQNKPPGLASPVAVPVPKLAKNVAVSELHITAVAEDGDAESSVEPLVSPASTSSGVFESTPSESVASSPSPPLETSDAPVSEKAVEKTVGEGSAKSEVVSPITPATTVVTPTVKATTTADAAVVSTIPATATVGTDSVVVTETKEVKDRKSRREREKAKLKEQKDAKIAAATTPAVQPSTEVTTVSVPSVSAAVSPVVSVAPIVTATSTTTGASAADVSKAGKTKSEKTEKVEKANKKASKGLSTPVVPVAVAPAEDAKQSAVSTAKITSTASVPVPVVTKTKSKTAQAPPSAAEVKNTSTSTVPAAVVSTGASKPPLANRGKLSPLRLQQPSTVLESNPAEDSPLFRYSGQLLDPSRDSSAELNALPDFPTPVRNSLAPFPTLSGAALGGAAHIALRDSELSGSDKSGLLTHPLSQDLWPEHEDHDPVASLGLDLELDLNLDKYESKYDSLGLNYEPLASPDNILRAGTTSELRVTADPFFSRGFEPRAKPSASSHGIHRDRTSSASNYLNDLLNSATDPFGDSDDFSFSTNSSARNSSGKGGAREWWPSGALPTESLGSTGRAHLQPDSYFDLGVGGRNSSYGNGSPPGQWSSGAEMGPADGRRGPGFSPPMQFHEPEQFTHHPPQRFQPAQRAPHDELYHNQGQPLPYGNVQGDSFYRPALTQAGIYNEPQELSRPVFDRTDRGGRESDHARYAGPGGFDGSLLHSRSPPQPRHKQGPPQVQHPGQPQMQQRQFSQDPYDPINSHSSYDFLDLDRAVDEDANSWIHELTRPNEMEQAHGQGRRLAAPTGPFGYAPEPAYGAYEANVPRGVPMQQPQHHVQQQRGVSQQQQQLRRLEQLRNRQGAPPGGLIPGPYAAPVPGTRYGAPPNADMQGMGGFADPFSRPEPTFTTTFSTSPGRDTENARWLALNAAAQRSSGDVRMRSHSQQQMQGPPGMQHMRPSNANAPLAGYAPHMTHPTQQPHASPYNAHGTHAHTSQLAQLQAQDPRELASMAPFGRDMAAVAQEMNFFHTQSFFGDASNSHLADVALESLEGEDDNY